MPNLSPCLTASRSEAGGRYINARQRLVTLAEICRLKRLPPDRFGWCVAGVSQKDFLHAVGNAVSTNALARVLDHALFAAGWTEDEGAT